MYICHVHLEPLNLWHLTSMQKALSGLRWIGRRRPSLRPREAANSWWWTRDHHLGDEHGTVKRHGTKYLQRGTYSILEYLRCVLHYIYICVCMCVCVVSCKLRLDLGRYTFDTANPSSHVLWWLAILIPTSTSTWLAVRVRAVQASRVPAKAIQDIGQTSQEVAGHQNWFGTVSHQQSAPWRHVSTSPEKDVFQFMGTW